MKTGKMVFSAVLTIFDWLALTIFDLMVALGTTKAKSFAKEEVLSNRKRFSWNVLQQSSEWSLLQNEQTWGLATTFESDLIFFSVLIID